MASLTALNTASDDTLTATDLRNATLIFSFPSPYDIEMVESLGQTQIDFQYPFDIIEMIRPDLINLEIDIVVPITPAVTVSATGLPSGVALTSASQTYTITGIDSVDDWDDSKTQIKINIPSGYTGSFEYDVTFRYYQVPDGNTSQTYTVGVARPDAYLAANFGLSVPATSRLTTETNYNTVFAISAQDTYFRGVLDTELPAVASMSVTPNRLRDGATGGIDINSAFYEQGIFGNWAPVTSGVRNKILDTVFDDIISPVKQVQGDATVFPFFDVDALGGYVIEMNPAEFSAFGSQLSTELYKTGIIAELTASFTMPTVQSYIYEGIYETQPSAFGMTIDTTDSHIVGVSADLEMNTDIIVGEDPMILTYNGSYAQIYVQSTDVFTILWGDGTIDRNITSGEKYHSFVGGTGTYTVQIYANDPIEIGTNYPGQAYPDPNLLRIEQWPATGLTQLKVRSTKLTTIPNSQPPQHGGDWSWALSGCTSLNCNLSNLVGSSATDLYSMMLGCTSFNGSVYNWNTSNVTRFNSLFSICYAFNQPINQWNTSSVTNISQMFYASPSFNQNLNSWQLGNVTNMFRVFGRGVAQTNYAFNGDISNWNTSSVTNMGSLFNGANNFNQDISGWNTGVVTDMSSMFANATSFDQDISGWNVNNVTNSTNFDSNTSSSWTAAEKPTF